MLAFSRKLASFSTTRFFVHLQNRLAFMIKKFNRIEARW